MRFDMRDGFPLVTTKKLHLPSIIHELLWLLSGDTNIQYLKDKGVKIWDAWADEDGNLGRVYGAMWRNWQGMCESKLVGGAENGKPCRRLKQVDQIAELIDGLKNNPTSRRHIVTAWNPAEIQDMALPPCHCFFQCYVHEPTEEGGKRGLSLILHQRSADLFLGVPFNIASYSLLLHMLAQVCGYEAREFIHNIGDAHIYSNHESQVREQLTRNVKILPQLHMNNLITDIDDFEFKDFKISNYEPYPTIKAPVAV